MSRLTAALARLAVVLTVSSAVQAEDPVSLLHRIDEGFVAIFDRVAPTVVVVEATKKEEDDDLADLRRFDFLKDGDDPHKGLKVDPHSFGFPRGPIQSEGSGFFIRPDGHLLTNLHVVEGAEKLEVKLKDGRRFPAKIVGADDKSDIAVLKIDAQDLPVATLGDSDALRVGQLVCAIGAPFNQDYSFTCGWVSGKGRTNLLGATSPKLLYEDYIQTDAFINPGNSGGPLFDVDGSVVGMNTLINGLGRGLAFAIPSNMLRDISDQLIATGQVHRSWLGIRMVALDDSGPLREKLEGVEQGIVVHTIEAKSPAYQSELRAQDVITGVDGRSLRTPRELQKEILKRKVGTTVQLTVWRAGKTVQVPVTTGELPEDYTKVASYSPDKPAEPKNEILGLTLKDTETGAARIVGIAPDSPAAKAELAVGDVVTAVNTEPKPSAVTIVAAILEAADKTPKKGILLNFERDGKKSWAVIERPSE